ncbi:hypothetical protein GDO81_010301 [Engystomops pustulosus]|uniref:Uncharacterized protein n=1 Tax=Engystomops pustulosus TaxID=76066 RepID=A0AAV7BYQ6_ENGPU|nr:hypothetical protein GDO81_010301 [Engystomops pustulosus]
MPPWGPRGRRSNRLVSGCSSTKTRKASFMIGGCHKRSRWSSGTLRSYISLSSSAAPPIHQSSEM